MRDTTQPEKARAVFLALIMVLSVFGAGFTGMAAANATNVTAHSATDIAVDQDSVTQEVSFNVTLDDAENDTITINTSEVRDANASIESANLNSIEDPGSFNVTNVSVNNDGNVDVEIKDDDAGSEARLSVYLTYDTQDLDDTDGDDTITYALNSTKSDANANDAVSFGTDQQGIVDGGSPDDVDSSTTQQSINNTRVFVGDVSDESVYVYYEISSLSNNGVDLDSVEKPDPNTFEVVEGDGATYTSSQVGDFNQNEGQVLYMEVANVTDDYLEFNVTSGGTFDASNADTAQDLNHSVAASFGSQDSSLDAQNDAPSGAPYTANYDLNDNSAPTLDSVEAEPGNDTVVVEFSEDVQNDSGSAIDEGDLRYVENNAVGASGIESVSHTAGESTATVTLDAGVNVDDLSTDRIEVRGDNSIQDFSDNFANNNQGTTLEDTVPPTVEGVTVEPDPATNETVNNDSVSTTVTVSFSEQMDQGTQPTVEVSDTTTTVSNSSGTFLDATTYEVMLDLSDDNEDLTANVSVADGQDLAGNLQDPNPDSDAGSFTVDTEEPVVTTDYTANTLLSGDEDATTNFTVTQSADDSSVTYAYNDSESEDFTPIDNPESFDTTQAADGDVVIRATAEDDVGNMGSVEQTVNVDNTAPQNVSLEAPSELVVKNTGSSIDVDYSYVEANPDSVTLTFSSDEAEENVVYTLPTGNSDGTTNSQSITLNNANADSGNFTNATYDLSLEVTDVADQNSSDTNAGVVAIDDIGPDEVNVVEPWERQIVTESDTLQIGYRYTEDNTDEVQIELVGANGDTISVDDSAIESNGIEKTITVDVSEFGNVDDGAYDLQVTVVDQAANKHSATIGEDYVVINNDAPIVDGVTVENDQPVGPTDEVDVSYNYDGEGVNASSVDVIVEENSSFEDVDNVRETYEFDVDFEDDSDTVTIDLGDRADIVDNRDYTVDVEVTDEEGDTTEADSGVDLNLNENAPEITDVEVGVGSNTAEITFSEDVVAADGDGIDATAFTYQNASGEGADKVHSVESHHGDTVVVNLRGDVTEANLGNDTISVRSGQIHDVADTPRFVPSDQDVALADTTDPDTPDITASDIGLDNQEDFDVDVTWNEEVVDVELELTDGDAVVEDSTNNTANAELFEGLNVSSLDDGEVTITVTLTDAAGNSVTYSESVTKDTDEVGIDSVESNAGTDTVIVTFDESVNSPSNSDFQINGFDAQVEEVNYDSPNTYELELDSDIPASAFDEDAPANVTATGVVDDVGNGFDGDAVNFTDSENPTFKWATTKNGSDTVTVKFSELVYGADDGAVTAENLTYDGDNEIVEVEHTAGEKVATIHLNESVSGDDIGTDAIAASEETPFVDAVGKEGQGSATLSHKLMISNYEVSAENGTITVSFDASNDLSATEIEVRHGHSLISLEGDDSEDTVAATLTLDDFEEDSGTYTASFDAPRDGQYEAEMMSVEDVAGNTQENVVSERVVVDDKTVSPDEAIIGDVTGDEDDKTTEIRVTFTEPIEGDDVEAEDVSIAGETVTDVDASEDDRGLLTVYVEGDVQTGDKPEIVVEGDSYSGHAAGENGVEDGSATILTDRVHLTEGTNFVSVPAAAGFMPLDEVDTSNVDAIWAYDAEDDSWQVYDPEASENDFDHLDGGHGYIVEMQDDATWDVNVHNVPGEGEDVDDSVPNSNELTEGWNLIGHYQEHDQSVRTGLSSALEGEEPYRLYAQADGSASMEYQSYNAGDFHTMERGEAYWVFVQDDETYTEAPMGQVV